ncbi:hypothetical protein AXG93_2956s1080 [Marchantia polymorpha subsp. ruderalis]|uniref:Plant heme peroxidase family profile domain-containing protein n=1 Tax=Marchantia polymorpha subsp. ruderalis TaxID=1480154 RepID=A0A176WAV6_MARPO|nr:hypothetical protein AXG93_2956s1080 [Marchantia polymorpha subsp. ruderalis]
MALRVQGEVDTNTYEDRLNDKLHVPVMRRGKVGKKEYRPIHITQPSPAHTSSLLSSLLPAAIVTSCCNQIDSKRKTMASPRVSLLLLVSLVFFAALSAAESLYATGLSESFYDTSCPQATSIVDAFVTKYLQKDRNFAGAFNRLQFHDCWVGVCLSRPFCEWNVSLSLY